MILVIPQHPENPSRLLCIWRRFLESGIAERCVRVARRAALEEIQCCHAETHALVYGTDMVNRCTLTGSQELNRDNRSAVKWNNSIESYSNQNENDTISFFLSPESANSVASSAAESEWTQTPTGTSWRPLPPSEPLSAPLLSSVRR